MTDIDLTKIAVPLGELDSDAAGALLYAYYVERKTLEIYYERGWIERDQWAGLFMQHSCTYRLKPEPQTPDYVNWEMLPDWVHYVARNSDGDAFGYECQPISNGDYWQSGSGYCIRVDRFSDKLFKAGDLLWGQSLIERPKGE